MEKGEESNGEESNGGMILVMGVTGAGKSTFINSLKPGSVVVGHGLESSKFGPT
jgi:putative ribosome biogenesis GTPase RsgA